jgi:cytochrome c biogenesis protein CcmG/thiol:disulfide interchange protein DsbE
MVRYLIPVSVFAALVVFFALSLDKDPRRVPSPLIGKPVPQFSVPTLKDPARTLSQADLHGKVSLFNVWASWCVDCRAEHPFLMEVVRKAGVPLYGLNYKDTRRKALGWLNDLGDPYTEVGFDQKGTVAINWGVYGVPETYVIDKHGIIRDKVIGPLTVHSWEHQVLPLIRKLQKEKG